jgi:phosphatidylglycerol:prolipoprotein diacylglycerol transferase
MFPILFSTPWFNVYSYGLLIALGYSLGTFWILKEAQKDGLPSETVFDMLILQLIVGISGSRILFLAEYSPENLSLSGFLKFEQGGLTFYGAVLSSIIFDLLFLKFHRLSFWRVMDCVGFGLPLGIMLARIGCFLNGCCYGTQCSWPWGVTFPVVSTQKLHPTQLYESFSGLLIFLILQKFKPFRKNYGEAFVGCMGLYGFFRFFIEFWRADNPKVIFGLQLSQIIGLLMVAGSIVAWKLINKYGKLRIIPPTGSSVNKK